MQSRHEGFTGKDQHRDSSEKCNLQSCSCQLCRCGRHHSGALHQSFSCNLQVTSGSKTFARDSYTLCASTQIQHLILLQQKGQHRTAGTASHSRPGVLALAAARGARASTAGDPRRAQCARAPHEHKRNRYEHVHHATEPRHHVCTYFASCCTLQRAARRAARSTRYSRLLSRGVSHAGARSKDVYRIELAIWI